MLRVKTPEEVLALMESEFESVAGVELVSLAGAMGRVLGADIAATEYVPDFNRSTVDGYAVRARDTFGCTDAIPAILPLQGEVFMGQGAEFELNPEECVAVPTGGAIPNGADSVVMVEYTEDYGDGTIGVSNRAKVLATSSSLTSARLTRSFTLSAALRMQTSFTSRVVSIPSPTLKSSIWS